MWQKGHCVASKTQPPSERPGCPEAAMLCGSPVMWRGRLQPFWLAPLVLQSPQPGARHEWASFQIAWAQLSNHSHPSLPSLPRWGPGYQGAKTSPSHCSLLEFITHGISEHNESMVVCATKFGVVFLFPSSNQNNEAYTLLTDLHGPNPKTSHCFPSPVDTLMTPRPAELSETAEDLLEPCYIRSRNQQPQHHLGGLRTVPPQAPSQTYWIRTCLLIRSPG